MFPVYRLKYKKTKQKKPTKKWFLQERKWFFFWEDVQVRTMKLYSVDKHRLIKTVENTLEIEVIKEKDFGHTIYLIYK